MARPFDFDGLAADERRRAEADAGRVLRGFWRKLGGVFARVPFADDLVAAYYCALDRNTPTRVRMVLFGALAYFILPFDAVPDVLVGLGFTDDAAVLFAALKLIGAHVTDTHRAAARDALDRLSRGEAVQDPR